MARFAVAAFCATALFSQAVTAYRPGDEVCVVSDDNTCPLDKLTTSKTDGSTLIFPGGNTRCAYNDYTNAENNFTTNSTFFFQVFPAEKAEKKKLLHYLQGGGACVDDNTCGFGLQCAQQTFQPNALALSIGILNRSEPSNVFNDWNIVHVPYCTGDIHIGNTEHSGKDLLAAMYLNKTGCLNQNQTTHQNGYNNAQSAFKWALANYPEIDQLAISGSSAGALGAQMYGKYISDMWQAEEKKIPFAVLSDSYVGVVPANKPAANLINYYNACTLPVSLPASVVTQCLNNTGTVVDLMSPIIKETKSADWFYADSMADRTQRQFYELFRQGIFAFPFKNTISGENFYSNMSAILDDYKEDTATIATFFEAGDRHVFFTLNNWTEIASADGTTTLGVMVRDILAGNFTYENASANSNSSSSTTTAPTAGGSAAMSLKATLSLAMVAAAGALAL